MTIAVPLSERQVAAANRIYLRLERWQITDRALRMLAGSCPEFGPEETLLKVVAINGLYATNVYAIDRMADHIRHIVQATDIPSSGPELVERIAALPQTRDQKSERHHTSFASKFAHFFVDSERFPIYDSVANDMARLHLGREHWVQDTEHVYEAFVSNIQNLKLLARLSVSNRELDRYLWIAGQFRKWQAGKRDLNAELLEFFDIPSGDAAPDLNALRL